MYPEWLSKARLPIPESESSTGSGNDTPTGSSSTSVTSAETADPDLDLNLESAVVSEPELEHHYVGHTWRSLAAVSTEESQHHSWCIAVPTLAKTSAAVRSGMLALSACCMYTHSSRSVEGDRATLLRVAYSHYNACLRESGPQLQKLDETEHVNAIVVTTRILFALGLAFCQIERRLGKSLADPECWAWLPLLRGNFAVMKAIESSERGDVLLQNQDLRPETPFWRSCGSCEARIEKGFERTPVLDFLRQARLPSLSSLRQILLETVNALSPERYSQFTQAIDLLDEVFTHICLASRIPNFVRIIFIWPCRVSSEFSEALTRGDKFALIIYAQWLMLTVLLEDLWIVGDMGRAGIFEIIARSGEWSEREQGLLAWPRTVLSVGR